MSVLVSINCITYNQESYISEAIDSFMMQKTDFDFEILIGEDCSTDSTGKIVEMYQAKYPDRIRIITSDKNVGFMKNMIRLHENSKGKYIAICEGDDYWTDEHKLQKQIDYLEKNTDCTLCFHAAEVVKAKNKAKVGLIRPYNDDNICKTEEIIIGGGDFCPSQSLVYRKTSMDNPPDFFAKSPIGDYPLQIIATSKGYAYYMDEIMSAYRKGDSNSWSSRVNSVNKQLSINERTISMLDQFNVYTNYSYDLAVRKQKLMIEFNSLIISKKTKEIKNGKYKEYYNSLSLTRRLKIYISSRFPKIYFKLIELKYM